MIRNVLQLKKQPYLHKFHSFNLKLIKFTLIPPDAFTKTMIEKQQYANKMRKKPHLVLWPLIQDKSGEKSIETTQILLKRDL